MSAFRGKADISHRSTLDAPERLTASVVAKRFGWRYRPQKENGKSNGRVTPAVQQRWDDWCDSRINNFLAGDYEDSIAEFVVEWNKKLTPLREELAKLREEIALLRTEQERNSKGGERSGSSGLVLVRDHRYA